MDDFEALMALIKLKKTVNLLALSRGYSAYCIERYDEPRRYMVGVLEAIANGPITPSIDGSKR